MGAVSKRTLPLEGETLTSVMGQLKHLVSASYDTLLVADGPPQPDYKLLDLCSEALHAAKEAAAVRERRVQFTSTLPDRWSEADRAAVNVFSEEWQRREAAVTKLCRSASKLKATTPAGIYAKALLVRMSATGAAVLAMSLAVDLVECEGQRATLWPCSPPWRVQSDAPVPLAYPTDLQPATNTTTEATQEQMNRDRGTAPAFLSSGPTLCWTCNVCADFVVI